MTEQPSKWVAEIVRLNCMRPIAVGSLLVPVFTMGALY